MSLTINRLTKTLLATIAMTASLTACGAEYDSTQLSDQFQGMEEAVGMSEDAVEEEVASMSEAVFYSDSVACAQYEAENIGRTGGAAGSQGWRLRYAGEDINVVRQFTSGQHQFSVVAWGTKGTDGSLPKIRVKLNDIQIGGDVTVTNVAYTSGWSEYIINYSIQTAGNKRIKVELANPGSGRAVLIDGIIVHCPGDGVVCGSDPYAEACCPASGQMIPGQCSSQFGTGTIYCDQNSDCESNQVCAFKGNAQTGYAVSCEWANECTSGSGFTCGKLCKTPTTAQTACGSGTVCSDVNLPGFLVAPGYKYCQ